MSHGQDVEYINSKMVNKNKEWAIFWKVPILHEKNDLEASEDIITQTHKWIETRYVFQVDVWIQSQYI